MMAIEIPRRGRGRPRGSRDLGGRARRVEEQTLRNFAVALARNIRAARLERHISIDELHAATGVHSSVLNRIEQASSRGRLYSPRFVTLVKIALALGVSPSEVMP